MMLSDFGQHNDVVQIGRQGDLWEGPFHRRFKDLLKNFSKGFYKLLMAFKKLLSGL